MRIVVYSDVGEFAQIAGPMYAADPVRHTVALSVLDGLERAGEQAAALLTMHDPGEETGAGACVGALLRSPARPAIVSGVPVSCAAMAERALADVDPTTAGVAGPVPEAEACAAARAARSGEAVHVDMRMRLFSLDTLIEPDGVPGTARRGGEDDVDTIAEWRVSFSDEANDGRRDERTPREAVLRSLRLGFGELLWEVDGIAVAQATARRPAAGMSRIGPIYTTPEHRRRGFGAAVTAAASRWALDAGAERVLLFTDLANPTANALYPRIGYRPVHDAVELRFA